MEKMSMRNKILFAAVLLLAMAVPGLAFAAPPDDITRVVYHVNQGDPAVHVGAVRNVQNHINAMGAENLDIKVVMHGGGLNLLVGANENPDLQAAVDSLKLQGVDFQICRNTMVSRQMQLDALYDAQESDIVDSGVAQLSILQRQGYTYIKP
jgi:intracellular sulfur oxidation DsrE/DsrF family protein